MPLRHKIYYALAGLHLLMIMLFATHYSNWGQSESLLHKGITTLGYYSGSNNVFSFFAPGLSDQPYVIYTVRNKDGREFNVDFSGGSPDFRNRLNNIYGYLAFPESRQVFSASLANVVSLRYPQSSMIRVAMVVQQIPSMAEYRSGIRRSWHYWFHNDFKKDSLLP